MNRNIGCCETDDDGYGDDVCGFDVGRWWYWYYYDINNSVTTVSTVDGAEYDYIIFLVSIRRINIHRRRWWMRIYILYINPWRAAMLMKTRRWFSVKWMLIIIIQIMMIRTVGGPRDMAGIRIPQSTSSNFFYLIQFKIRFISIIVVVLIPFVR